MYNIIPTHRYNTRAYVCMHNYMLHTHIGEEADTHVHICANSHIHADIHTYILTHVHVIQAMPPQTNISHA